MGGRRLVALGLLVAGGIAYACCRHGGDGSANGADTPAIAAGASNPFDVKRARRGEPDDASIAVDTLQLDGRVVDEHARPVAGANVTLDGRLVATTDADGAFVIDDLAPDDYLLAAEVGATYGDVYYRLDNHSEPAVIAVYENPTVAIHVVDRAGAPIAGAKLSMKPRSDVLTDRDGIARFHGLSRGGSIDILAVAAGFAERDIKIETGLDPARHFERTIVLDPSALIGGMVLDQDGRPVAGAQVEVTPESGVKNSVETDAQGHWQLDGVGPGKVAAQASSAAHVATPEQIVQVDGLHPKLDIVLRVELGATVGGVVVDATGAPVAGAHVRACMDADRDARDESATSDDKGHFLVEGVTAGAGFVAGTDDRRGTPAQQIQVPRAGHVDVRLVMAESSIAGIVTDAHGEGMPGVSLVADATTNLGVYDRPSTVSDEHGHFDFGGVQPGTYEVSAELRSAMAREPRVTVESGDRHVALTVQELAALTGRVVCNGAPVDNFAVTIGQQTTAEGGISEWHAVRSADGHFEEKDLSAGTYSVAVSGPAFRRMQLPDVVLAYGQRLDLGDITVVRGRYVRGSVITAAGAPVADAAVVVASNLDVEREPGPFDAAMVTHTDAAGRFEIDGLADDVAGQLIQAWDPERGVAMPRALQAGELDSDIQLVLAPTGAIAVTYSNPIADQYYRASVAPLESGGRAIPGLFVEPDGLAISNLPIGDYAVTLSSGPPEVALQTIQVTVSASATTPVAFELP